MKGIDPWWQAEESTIDNPFRYCGEYLDLSSGFYYLRARDYDSVTQRFLTEDSYSGQMADPLSLNLYPYCENDPINFVDPTGNGKAAIFGKGMKKDINDVPRLASLIVGFTPVDGAKDIADLIAGKDIFSQERTNRGVLLICVFTPEILDKVLKSGSKMVLKSGSDVLKGFGSKTEAYITKRGWTWDSMIAVVNKPYITSEATNKLTGNAATAYYTKVGDYVVVDNITGDLVQVSKFGDTGWIPDATIKNPYNP